MRDVSIGQYYQVDSVIHRLDARVKLLLTVCYIVMIFFVKSFFGYGVIFCYLIVIALLSRVPLLKLLSSLKMIIFLLMFTVILTVFFYTGEAEDILIKIGFLTIYNSALVSAGMLACRLVLFIVGPTILTLTTTPVELTDAIERVLWPLSVIKVPVHELAMIMSIALRLIPTLSEETEKIISAQKARGADFESGNLFSRAKAMIPILIPLFVSSFRRADDLAYAMDSRCYRGAKGRTRMKEMKMKARDYMAIILFALAFFVVLNLTYNYFSLSIITLLCGV